MSVRRLAADAVQPTGFAFSNENDAWAERTIRKYPEGRQQSAVIPLLMRAQDQEGWVTRAAIEHVADRLAMPLIRVLEVATFYTQFQLKPVGTKAHVQVCGTTPCMLRGADELKAVCRKRIHPEQFQTNEAGTLSWEEVECLGACVNAPMVMVFKDTYEDLTPERLAEIIDAFEADETVKPGPQIDRHLSVPVGGATTLTSLGDDEEIGEREHGPANGSPPQGVGGGDKVSVAPSEAARVDTHAQETDPALKTPATDRGVAADQAAEEAASADPDAGAGPGAGREGGQRHGETGAAAKEQQETEASVAPEGAGRSEGTLPRKEKRAEAAVVPDKRRPTDGASEGGQAAPEAGELVEGRRGTTSDTGAAEPVAGQEAGQAAAASQGRRPEGLLAEAPADADDLKRINGIGPVIERKLNELGVWRVGQVAAWGEPELQWIDDQLNLRGRALRDRWSDQARELAATKGE